VDRLTTLFIYGILALMWNALAGYAGLVSIGQQAFFGLGAYAAVRLANAGISVYPALLLGAVLVAVVSLPISAFMLRLRAGEFAIGMWVVAELAHLLVNLDTLINGETGTSLIELQRYAAHDRRLYTYWAALATMVALGWLVYLMLRGRLGSAAQAIRDNEEAADSIGVRVLASKRLIFVLSAFGCAAAGALWVAAQITFQPKAYFSVQWSAYMIFMVLVGGIGTYEGPILGAILFFTVEALFAATGHLGRGRAPAGVAAPADWLSAQNRGRGFAATRQRHGNHPGRRAGSLSCSMACDWCGTHANRERRGCPRASATRPCARRV